MKFYSYIFCRKLSIKKKIESYLDKLKNGKIENSHMHQIIYEELLKIYNNSLFGICCYHIPTFYQILYKRYKNEFRCRIEN